MPRKKKPTERAQALRFAAALLVIFLALAGFSLWRGHETRAAWLAFVAPVPLVLALVAPGAWAASFRAWMRFGERLSRVSTVVILSLFYYLVFTPISLVRRLFGGSGLDVAWRDGRESYWVKKPLAETTVERYEKLY